MHLPRAPRSIASLLVVPLFVASLALPGQSSAQPPHPLNDTGIDWCAGRYDNNLLCPVADYPGQDGEFGRDVTDNDATDGHAGFSVTKLDPEGEPLSADALEWSCVLDNVTGAIWEVKTDDDGLRDKNSSYTWYDSDFDGPGYPDGGFCATKGRCDTEKYVEDVNAQALCGFSDWRMPTPKELAGIIHRGRANPAIDISYFPNTRPDSFWSSSSSAVSPIDGWSVDFKDGSVRARNKYIASRVRLVRAEQPWSSFVDNGDGTITDANTGLMWAQCSAGQNGGDCATDSAEKMTWKEALIYANDLTLANYSDWRLPNSKELQSLIDYSDAIPAIDEQFFPATPTSGFWSSSPYANGSIPAWQVDFGYGSVDYSYKSSDAYVRLVRAGQWFGLLSLQVSLNGTGSGTVTSNPAGIDCGTDCSEVYQAGTEVTLTATPVAGSEFGGWSDASCGTATTCTFTLNSAKTVTATFSDSSAGGDCTTVARTLTEAITGGAHEYQSQTAITVAGTVQVGQAGALTLMAPQISFEPGFRVAAGGQLHATAGPVQCAQDDAALRAAETSTRTRSLTEGRSGNPAAALGAEALPVWLQARLDQLGVDLEGITTSLLSDGEDWLILETTQTLQTSDQNAASDLYRLDLLSDQLQLISATEQGQAGNGPSRYPAADASGERIVFHSEADDLVPNDTNGVSDLFLRDLALEQTIRLTDAEQASANPALDALGDRLVYDQGTQAGPRQVIGQALAGGTAAEVLSLQTNNTGIQVDNHHPAISADGRFIAYLEHSVIGDEANLSCQVHLYDRDTEVYHRQPCPEALASTSDEASVRGVFSEDAQSLGWYLPGVAEPIRVSNPLAQ